MKQEKEENKKLHNSNFFEACKNAVNGIIYGTTTQSNVKKQLVIIAFVMLISLFFNLSKVEFICLIFACVLIIFAEMVNTAVETVVDLYVDVYHPSPYYLLGVEDRNVPHWCDKKTQNLQFSVLSTRYNHRN